MERTSILKKVIAVFSWLVFAYFMIAIHFLFQTSLEGQAIALCISFFVIFLPRVQDTSSKWLKIFFIVLLIAGIWSAGYVKVFFDHLEASVGFPEQTDILVGLVLMAVVLIATWVAWGPLFSLLALVAILYFFIGHHLPHPLYHPHIDFGEAVSRLSVGLQGIFGSLLGWWWIF